MYSVIEIKKSEHRDKEEAVKRNVPGSAQAAGKVWKKRLLSLDLDEQYRIAQKYYGGHMPWKE